MDKRVIVLFKTLGGRPYPYVDSIYRTGDDIEGKPRDNPIPFVTKLELVVEGPGYQMPMAKATIHHRDGTIEEAEALFQIEEG